MAQDLLSSTIMHQSLPCRRSVASGRYMQALALLFLANPAGCHKESDHDLSVIAPTFDTSQVDFTKYEYSTVGMVATTHSDLIPFIDANGDGLFDSQNEASGRCDPRSRTCWLDHTRLRMINSATGCPATSGTWLLGNVYGRTGTRLNAALCDDQGMCSEEHTDVFKDVPATDAI